jgi:cytochrome b subunit of formate dehydrogenase
LLKKIFFRRMTSVMCNCANCLIVILTAGGLLIYALYRFKISHISLITLISLLFVVAAAILCNYLSKREVCNIDENEGGAG